MSQCFTAGPRTCALAQPSDKSPSDIEKRIDTFIDHLQEHPQSVLHGPRKALLTSGTVRREFSIVSFIACKSLIPVDPVALFHAIQNPAHWSSFTSALSYVMSPSPTKKAPPLLSKFTRPFSKLDLSASKGYRYRFRETGQEPLGRLAISCADAVPYGTDSTTWPSAESIVDKVIETLAVSRRFGAT